MSNSQRIAKLIVNHLRKRHWIPAKVNVSVVHSLVDILFYASLKTEESRGVFCTVVFGADLTSSFDSTRRPHRHNYVPLETPLSFTARNLAKFAQAALPWASCIAVNEKNGELQITGLFDQEIHHQNSLNNESEDRFRRPGLFQVEVTGTGTLTVYDNRTLLATLHQDALVTTFYDVLNEGPVAKHLAKYVERLEGRIKTHFSESEKHQNIDALLVDAPQLWLQTLSRILLGIRRLKHGGALLLIPSKPTADLSAKYPMHYDKMEAVLEKHLVASIRWQIARSQIRGDYREPPIDSIPAALDTERRKAFNDREDAKRAELGCANFIVSLAGVDGLILLSEGLRVVGFGVEIKTRKDPERVFSARNTNATLSKLKELDFTHLGTRHRSMMRYCNDHPGSLGFVISQDGDVRAITRTSHGLVVWENIRLQEVNLAERTLFEEDRIGAIQRRQSQIELQLSKSVFYELTDDTHEPLVKRKAWLTATKDPLKIEIETEENNNRNTVKVYFHEQGWPNLVVTRQEKPADDGHIHVEDTSQYFVKASLVKMETKAAQFAANETHDMHNVRARQVNIAELSDSESHADRFHQKGDEILKLLIHHPHLSRRFEERFPNNDRYRLIQGTCAPNGQYALGFGLSGEAFDWQALAANVEDITGYQHYLADSDVLAPRIQNYVEEIESQKVLGETGCHFIGTRRRFNHRECWVAWSLDSRYLVQIFLGKWHSIEAIAGHISESGTLDVIDLLSSVTSRAYGYLRERKHRAYRRFGETFALQIYSVDINNTGLVTLHILGEIPKSSDDDSSFGLIERFKIVSGSNGLVLKFIDTYEKGFGG